MPHGFRLLQRYLVQPQARGIIRCARRTITRYANRKLYDTQESHYVTLHGVAELIRQGEEVRVVHHDTRHDLTAATMAQIIFEEEKRTPRLPLAGLRDIIQTGRMR